VLHRPLAAEAKLVSRPRIREVIDKGEGNAAIILQTRDLVDTDGTLVATVDSSNFARKHGGFGGKVTQSPPLAAVPDTATTEVCDLPTPPNLALLYRLNGDENPLHADPARATVAGFDRPILHGAASFGIAAHAVLRTCAGYRADRLKSIEARFSKPVFPGETIRTEMWPEGTRISFQCRVVGRGDIVLSNGLATLRD
jgi:acyl dehydratase